MGANAGEGGCLSSITHPSRRLRQEFTPCSYPSIRSVEKILGQGLGSFQDGRQVLLRVDLNRDHNQCSREAMISSIRPGPETGWSPVKKDASIREKQKEV